MTYGTSYFVSKSAAVRYYRDYEGSDAARAVERKLREGEIHIGKPTLKAGERLTTLDGGKRYAITSGNPRVKLPANWTPAKVRVTPSGDVQIGLAQNPMSAKGGRFARCVKSVEAKGGAYDARAVCGAMEKRARKNGKRKTLKRVGAALKKFVRGNPAVRTFDVHIPATRYDKGYRLTIKAKTKAAARAAAKKYCAAQFAKYTGKPASQYQLPAKTKVVEI